MAYVYAAAALGALTIIGLISMAADKSRAVRWKRRIPEKILFAIAFLGGGAGSLIGMYAFRHKTRHAAFKALIPVSAVWSIAAVFGAAYLIASIL